MDHRAPPSICQSLNPPTINRIGQCFEEICRTPSTSGATGSSTLRRPAVARTETCEDVPSRHNSSSEKTLEAGQFFDAADFASIAPNPVSGPARSIHHFSGYSRVGRTDRNIARIAEAGMNGSLQRKFTPHRQRDGSQCSRSLTIRAD